jgi:hypothetical protein
MKSLRPGLVRLRLFRTARPWEGSAGCMLGRSHGEVHQLACIPVVLRDSTSTSSACPGNRSNYRRSLRGALSMICGLFRGKERHQARRDRHSPTHCIERIPWAARSAASGVGYQRDVRADEGSSMTVWIYVDTSKQVGDTDHLKVLLSLLRVACDDV